MKAKAEFWDAVKWGLGIGLGLLTVRLVVEALSAGIPLAIDALRGTATVPSLGQRAETPPELGNPT